MTDSSTPAFPSVAEAVASLFGADSHPVQSSPVAGGCIANGTRVDLSTGERLFVKSGVARELLEAEADGLAALRGANAVRVPAPLAIAEPSAHPFLVLEWIPAGSPTPNTQDQLGRTLADLHRSSAELGFGFDHDNYIGSTQQPNGWTRSWLEFFAEQRLRFQTMLAIERGAIESDRARRIERLVDRLPDLLPEPATPSLIHGDLWGGNWMADTDGEPWIFDPAAHYAHREADLAMTRLFGGFGNQFFDAYQEAWPTDPGFEERVPIYNLYHVLNHVNLFGAGYLGQVDSTLGRYT